MKTYLVTGISRGLGMAIASSLLNEGHTVYGTFNTNIEAAEKLQQEFSNLNVIQADFSNSESVGRVVESLSEIELDGIVNSAGVFIDLDFDNFDKDSFENTFTVNAFTPVYLVQGLYKNLKENASVVNIASNDAMVGSIVGIAYSASKAALLNLTQSLANIVATKKIRVNAVAPGWMGDGMQAPDELLKIAADYNPLKRIGSYQEVADVVIFLLSDKSSYINGTTITVDGGDMATSYVLQKEAEI